MKKSIVEITVAGRVPVLLIVCGTLRAREESFFVDTRVAGLVEGGDADLLISVLFDDAQGIVVSVEGSHKNEGDIDAVGGVEVFDLTDGEIEEGHVILDLESTLRTGHTWYHVWKFAIIEKKCREGLPMEVPRPPLTLRTASLLRIDESLGWESSA